MSLDRPGKTGGTGRDNLTRKVDSGKWTTPGAFETFTIVAKIHDSTSVAIPADHHDVLKVYDDGQALVVRVDVDALPEVMRQFPNLEFGCEVRGEGALDDEWVDDGFSGTIEAIAESHNGATRTYHCRRGDSGGRR